MRFSHEPLSQLFEKTTATVMVVLYILCIVLSAALYYILSPYGHGLVSSAKADHISFGNCLYFSIVTITSLGYGDYMPVGFGKAAASFEILFGVSVIAAILTKLVSARESRLLILIFESQQREKLGAYSSTINAIRTELLHAHKEDDQAAMAQKMKELFSELAGVFRYTTMLSKAKALDIDPSNVNMSTLLNSLSKLVGCEGGCSILARRHPSMLKTMAKCVKYVSSIAQTVHNNSIDGDVKANASRLCRLCSTESQKIQWFELGYTSLDPKWGISNREALAHPELLDAVDIALPHPPYLPGAHVPVAETLGLSHSVAYTAVERVKIIRDRRARMDATDSMQTGSADVGSQKVVDEAVPPADDSEEDQTRRRTEE